MDPSPIVSTESWRSSMVISADRSRAASWCLGYVSSLLDPSSIPPRRVLALAVSLLFNALSYSALSISIARRVMIGRALEVRAADSDCAVDNDVRVDVTVGAELLAVADTNTEAAEAVDLADNASPNLEPALDSS